MTGTLAAAILGALACYALAMVLALVRLLRGPTAQDRVLALDFLYVVGMLASGMYFVAALLIALFGFVGSAALAKFLLRGEVIE